MIRKLTPLILLLAALPLSVSALPLSQLNLPRGFSVAVFANVDDARQLTRSDRGTVFVGSRRAGKVYAVTDADADGVADRVRVIARNLDLPSGVAFRDGHLYVGAINRILRYDNIDDHLDDPPEPVVITAVLPDARHHGWKYLDFGPDGLLYVPVGAPCNICLSKNPLFASILTLDVEQDPPVPDIYAQGVRNSVGFTWHPVSGQLWFTDNGRDMLGDDLPPCELNVATRRGQHFGYPFVHARDIADPEFGRQKTRVVQTPPVLELGPHVAPLGLVFHSGTNMPAGFRHRLLIAEHGSWNRSASAGHTGYRITMAVEQEGTLSYQTFIDGWLQENKAWGRPVDLEELPDGSLLISDDLADVIYRVTFDASP